MSEEIIAEFKGPSGSTLTLVASTRESAYERHRRQTQQSRALKLFMKNERKWEKLHHD